VVLMDDSAALDIDHSGAGTMATSVYYTLDEAVSAGYGITLVLFVETLADRTVNIGFNLTLEFEIT